jgi:hypothetical protein
MRCGEQIVHKLLHFERDVALEFGGGVEGGDGGGETALAVECFWSVVLILHLFAIVSLWGVFRNIPVNPSKGKYL